jgi:hypothetical protein
MTRSVHIVLIAAMIVGAVITYHFKYQAERAADRVALLREQVAAERDALSFVRAEWSILTQPARLQELIELHEAELGLASMDVDQIGELDQIPRRPVPEPAVVAGEPDASHTGAIAR